MEDQLNPPLITPALGNADAEMDERPINNGASVNAQSYTALMAALKLRPRLDVIGRVIDKGIDINHRNSAGKSALMMASEIGSEPDIIKFLIEKGANVDLQDTGGNTALLFSARVLKTEAVSILINGGADVNHRNKKGYTALMIAVKEEYSGNIIKLLTEKGGSVDLQDIHGNTALLFAARVGNIEALGILINRNADINHQNKIGHTALMIASLHKNAGEMMNLLIKKGSNVDVQDSEGNTALLLATRFGCKTEVLSTLINSGADINHHNEEGHTALMIASEGRDKGILELLVSAGADINAVNVVRDVTALSLHFKTYLYREDCYSCVKYLLEQGASSSYLGAYAFLNLIEEDDRLLTLVPELISSGLGPADLPTDYSLDTSDSSTVSPLCFALVGGNVDLARYFYETWFLTSSDVSSLAGNKTLRLHLERYDLDDCLEFLGEITAQPMPLQKLAFVAVSSAIGCVPKREDKVNSLPLPSVMKERLLFRERSEPLLRFYSPTDFYD